MPINTKSVKGRRSVHYQSLDELVADAENLARSTVRPLGNWTPGQIYEHLAGTFHSSIDGFDKLMPAPVRLLMSLLMKRKFLKKGLPSGFKSSSAYIPGEVALDDGLASLRSAITRLQTEPQRAKHPAFGQISAAEWNDFHLRHAELHMSFLVFSK